MKSYDTTNNTTNIVIDSSDTGWNRIVLGSNTELTMIVAADSSSVEYYINSVELPDAFGDILSPREDVSGVKNNIFIRKTDKNKNAKIIVFSS